MAKTKRPKTPRVSVVIPMMDEEQNVRPLYDEIVHALTAARLPFEIVFVDDGSTDGTFRILSEIARTDKRVVVARHRRNFGQSQGWRTGFRLARGDVVVTMDGDRQNDPADIPAMLDRIGQGADIVTGWRSDRQDNALKKIPSRLSNALAHRLTGLDVHDYGCALKAYRRECVQDLDLRGEMHRYLLALLGFKGYRIVEMPVRHRPRVAGRTKYGLKRLLRGFLDLLFVKFNRDYYSRPLHFFGGLGLSAMALSLVLLAYKLWATLLHGIPLEAGPLLIFSGILFVAGVQLTTLGFLAEIIIRIYDRQVPKEDQVEQVLNGKR